MKAIVKTVDGSEFTLIGDKVDYLHSYLRRTVCSFQAPTLLWIGDDETFINTARVVSIQFVETETEVELSEFK